MATGTQRSCTQTKTASFGWPDWQLEAIKNNVQNARHPSDSPVKARLGFELSSSDRANANGRCGRKESSELTDRETVSADKRERISKQTIRR